MKKTPKTSNGNKFFVCFNNVILWKNKSNYQNTSLKKYNKIKLVLKHTGKCLSKLVLQFSNATAPTCYFLLQKFVCLYWTEKKKFQRSKNMGSDTYRKWKSFKTRKTTSYKWIHIKYSTVCLSYCSFCDHVYCFRLYSIGHGYSCHNALFLLLKIARHGVLYVRTLYSMSLCSLLLLSLFPLCTL